MVNVWGGECLGGERLTILNQHLQERWICVSHIVLYRASTEVATIHKHHHVEVTQVISLGNDDDNIKSFT